MPIFFQIASSICSGLLVVRLRVLKLYEFIIGVVTTLSATIIRVSTNLDDIGKKQVHGKIR